MKIKVLLFGILAERAGFREKEYHFAADTDKLRQLVAVDVSGLEDYRFNISVNRTIISVNTKLNPGDEVAFLPPFAGG